MAYILETHDLTKRYGQKEPAKNVNLHVEEGKIYGLIGRNGAGKTTIMRMISGLSTPTRGTYSLFGKSGMGMKRMLKYVGVLIEHPGLYPRLSAYDNLKIKCVALGIRKKGYVEELLKTVGLENVDKKKGAGSFSLGMRQRLGIALALIGNPEFLVLDEPINGLDPQGIMDVRNMIQKINEEEGKTIIVSSHILSELQNTAHRFGMLYNGVVIKELDQEDLRVRANVTSINVADEDVEKATNALKVAGIDIMGTEQAMNSLENYYFSLIGGEDNA